MASCIRRAVVFAFPRSQSTSPIGTGIVIVGPSMAGRRARIVVWALPRECRLRTDGPDRRRSRGLFVREVSNMSETLGDCGLRVIVKGRAD
jgi:hypothetical protein